MALFLSREYSRWFRLISQYMISFAIFFGVVLCAETALALDLTPELEQKIITLLPREQNLEDRVKLRLLLIDHYQKSSKPDEELKYRVDLRNEIKPVARFKTLNVSNLHEIGKLLINSGESERARDVFVSLLEETPVTEPSIRNLALQYLSSISAKLNDKDAEEKYLAKYVISRGLSEDFYASKKGFEKLLELTESNGSNNYHSYFASWHKVAIQNGSVDDQKNVLTRWVNYTADKKAPFSDEPFNAFTSFLEEQNLLEELKEIRLLHAQTTPNAAVKAKIYEAIHQRNKKEFKDTDLGLLTFLYEYYNESSKEAEKQEILRILVNRPDYQYRESALKQLASISLKNNDYLQSFNAHEQLYQSVTAINQQSDLVVLNNLISLSRQLSRDSDFEKYAGIKALSKSPLVSDDDRLETFNLLMEFFQSTRQYQKAIDFYDRFTAEKVVDVSASGYYRIPFKGAVVIEKSNNFQKTVDLYNQSLELGLNEAGFKEEFVKIAQRVLNIVEINMPGEEEFKALNRLSEVYSIGEDQHGVAKTDLIIAQKLHKNGDKTRAIEKYNQSLEGYRQVGDKAQVSKILTLLTNLESGDSEKKLKRLEELEISLEKSEDSIELIKARVEIGNHYKLDGDVTNAKKYYLKAFNTVEPPTPAVGMEAGYFAALIATQVGDFEESTLILKEIIKQRISDENGRTLALSFQLLAKNYNSSGDPSQALQIIDQAITLNISELETSLRLTKSAIYISNRDFQEAIDLIDEISIDSLEESDQQTVYLYKAKAYLGLRQYENTLRSIENGLSLAISSQYSENVYELYSLKTSSYSFSNDINQAIENQTQLVEFITNEKVRAKLGEAYLTLADLYIQAGQLPNALENNQSASRYVENNRLLEVKILLNNAKINRLQNKLQQSVTYFEQINDLIDQSIPLALQAEIYYQAGYTYLQISRFGQALENFSKSERLFKEQRQSNEARQAKMAQANVLMKQGNIQKAEGIFQAALDESGNDKLARADIYGSLAYLFSELGQYNKALENSEKAEKLYRETDQTARLPEVLNARGLIFLKMNDFGQSEVLFLDALEKNKANDNPLLDSEITNNLGGLYKSKGELKKARVQLIKTAELQKNLGFESQLALTFNNIGSVYLEEEKFEEALDFLRQSREFATKFDLKKELAVSWNNEGILFFKQNKTEEAAKAFREALSLQEALSLRVDMARTLNNLSIIASEKEDKTEAVKLVQQAIETLSLKKLDSEKFYPNPDQNEVLAASLMKDFLQNKGAFMREIANTKKDNKSKSQYLDASYRSFDLSINLIEALRAQIKSEESQQLLLQKNIDIFQQMIAILYELGNLTEDIRYHKKAFFYAEKSRARSFLDQLQEQAARASLNLPKEVQEQESNFKSRLSQLDKNIFAELSKSKKDRDEEQIEKWQLEKTELNIQYTKLTKELETKYPAYASLRYPTVYGVEDVRLKLLDIESQCIVFFLGADVSYGWRVSMDQFEMIALPPNADIDQLIRKYRETLVNPLIFYDEDEDLDIDTTNSHLVTGLQIYRTFLKPLIGNTSDRIKNLLIIPDGVLYYLPFETVLIQMHSPGNKKYVMGREYLLNRYSVFYSPSTSVLGMIRQQSQQRDPGKLAARKLFVGFGDPQYAPTSEEEESFHYNPTLESLNFYEMPRLFGTSTEVKNISSMFEGKSTMFLGDEATETSAKDRILGYKYVHFATHGIMNEENPEYSGVVMNLVKGVESQDGFLQAAEIFDLKLDSDLVVLSACETGLGKVIKGEGMVGLTRAFLYAGSPSIVVSLWTVADDSTSRLMIHFYNYLKEGYSRSEALRQAKLTLLSEEVDGDVLYNDPFFWGPFILNGMSS